jgi:hypothetical protein
MSQPIPAGLGQRPDPATAINADDVSLIRGGPFYRAQQATRLISPSRWNLGRRISLSVAVAWLPLVLMTALFHPTALRSLLTDYRVTARMLIAVPVLLLGQVVMESRFRLIVQHLRDAGLLDQSGLSELDSVIGKLLRWRDSIWPELALIVAVYANLSVAFSPHIHESRPWALAGEGVAHLLPAGWYYVFVSQLVYQFLVGLSFWKWFLWCYFLFRLSRIGLQLVPTHPDRHGGIGFLGLSPMGIAPVMFAAAVAIGSNWWHQILAQGAHLASFKLEGAALLFIVLLIAIGPLVFFVPTLAKVRRQGLLDYGTLGQLHSIGFHVKWILNRTGHEEEFLSAPEVSTLTDYGSSYESIEKMQPFPVDKGAFISLALAVAPPMLPVVLAEVPLAVVLKGLLEALK